jgi:ACR3 family arsenite efflux pump ArsB
MAIKKETRNVIINSVVFVVLYGIFLFGAFVAEDLPPGTKGTALGMVIGLPLVVGFICLATIYFTMKNGGNGKKVISNLKRNLSELLKFSWIGK